MLHQSIIGRVRPILVTIKSSPIYPKVIPKGAIAIFTKSCIVFKIAQKLTKYLGYFGNKKCYQERSKIAQMQRSLLTLLYLRVFWWMPPQIGFNLSALLGWETNGTGRGYGLLFENISQPSESSHRVSPAMEAPSGGKKIANSDKCSFTVNGSPLKTIQFT